MNRSAGMGCIGVLASVFTFAAEQKPIVSTVCEVTRNVERFDDKIVRLRATLVGNFEISAIRDPDHSECDAMWFTYSGGGPAAVVSLESDQSTRPRPIVRLERDARFRHFQKMAAAEMHPKRRGAVCMSCSRYEVTATMTGLVESAGPNKGFGHLNGFPVQFVLQSIQETSVKDLASRYPEEDYSTEVIRFPTGYISGVLRKPDGGAVANGNVTIYQAAEPTAQIENDSATTDDKGRFRFAVPPGRYVIGFNTFWPPSPRFPFPPTYYPGAEQRSGAAVVEVGDRQNKQDLVFRLPKQLVPRTIPVQVLWPDGKAAVDANVWLTQKSETRDTVGTAISHTGRDGGSDLMGFEGIDYVLHAEKHAGSGSVFCAKTVLIRASQANSTRISLPLTLTSFNSCTDDSQAPPDAMPAR